VYRKPRRRGSDKSLLAEDYEYVEGFGSLVRRARESLGLSQEELASLIKEKATVIRKIEQGELHPPIDLAKRIEKVLKIRIVQASVEENPPVKVPRGQPGEATYTLEDLLKRSKALGESKNKGEEV